jgi:type II secretory pathway predicted ATPase ExeA
MLSRALIQHLEVDRYEIGLITSPRWKVVEFLHELLYQLGAAAEGAGRQEAVRRLHDLVYGHFRTGRDTVLVIDEAQTIEDDAVFEELRLLMNLQTDDRFLVTVMLVGTPELAARMRRLPHLDQRIGIRARLGPLDGAHTAAYIAHRLRTAGQPNQLFTPAAITRIFEATRGTPREINTVCDMALLLGHVKRAREIDGDTVAEALADGVRVA